MNNKIHKIDSGQSPAPATATYGPATVGFEYDLANGGGVICTISAVLGKQKLAPKAIKIVKNLADTTATDVFTVTVPNATLSASFEVDVLGILGAGGAIGAGEAVRLSKYQVTVVRTTGVNAVATVSAAIGGAAANVAGATTVASVVVTLSAIAGAVGAVNTFTVKVAITKTGGASANHTAVAQAEVQHELLTGITIA